MPGTRHRDPQKRGLQIIQLAELVKRFRHKGANVGETPALLHLTGRKVSPHGACGARADNYARFGFVQGARNETDSSLAQYYVDLMVKLGLVRFSLLLASALVVLAMVVQMAVTMAWPR